MHLVPFALSRYCFSAGNAPSKLGMVVPFFGRIRKGCRIRPAQRGFSRSSTQDLNGDGCGSGRGVGANKRFSRREHKRRVPVGGNSLLDSTKSSCHLGNRPGIGGLLLAAFLHADPTKFESHGEMIRFHCNDAHYYRHALEKLGREARTPGQVDLERGHLSHLRQNFRCTEVIEPDEDAGPAHIEGCSTYPNEPCVRRCDMTRQDQGKSASSPRVFDDIVRNRLTSSS